GKTLPKHSKQALGQPTWQSLSCCSREPNAGQGPNRFLGFETIRLDSESVATGCRANVARLLWIEHPAPAGRLYFAAADHFSSVNTCVYEPSAFRVLANWPRAPMYLPVPPNIARTTDLPALNSAAVDRKSTRLNSSHQIISYAVFCLKKKKKAAQIESLLT